MKQKIKLHVQNTLIYLTSSSILFSSCNGYFNEPISKEHFSEDHQSSVDLIPISIYLDSEEIDYLKKIENFSKQVFQNKEISTNFISNPISTLQKFGINDLDYERDEFEIIKALGDADVQIALNSGDFILFWKALESKGIFKNERSAILKQIKSKFLLVNSNSEIMKSSSYHEIDDRDAWAVILVVVVVVYAAVVTMAAVELAVAVHAGVHAYTATSVKILPDSNTSNVGNVIGNSDFYLDKMLDGNVLTLWKKFKSNPGTYYLDNSRKNIVFELLNEAKNQGIITSSELNEGLAYIDELIEN